MAYPQADLKADIFMHILWGFTMTTPDGQPAILKLVKNLYGLVNAGKTWYDHLHKGLLKLGFCQSLVNPCIFYLGNIIVCIYVNDMLLFSKTKHKIDNILEKLQETFMLSDEGDVSNYLGIHVTCKNDGSIKLMQPHLIQCIINVLGLQNESCEH